MTTRVLEGVQDAEEFLRWLSSQGVQHERCHDSKYPHEFAKVRTDTNCETMYRVIDKELGTWRVAFTPGLRSLINRYRASNRPRRNRRSVLPTSDTVQ